MKLYDNSDKTSQTESYVIVTEDSIVIHLYMNLQYPLYEDMFKIFRNTIIPKNMKFIKNIHISDIIDVVNDKEDFFHRVDEIAKKQK